MCVHPGATYLLPLPGKDSPHLFVVLTEPTSEDLPRVVIVGLTTKRFHSDTTVVLSPSDHPFLDKLTVPFYAKMRMVRVDELKDRAFRRYEDATPEVLRRLQQGAIRSPHTKPSLKSFCERVTPSTAEE